MDNMTSFLLGEYLASIADGLDAGFEALPDKFVGAQTQYGYDRIVEAKVQLRELSKFFILKTKYNNRTIRFRRYSDISGASSEPVTEGTGLGPLVEED